MQKSFRGMCSCDCREAGINKLGQASSFQASACVTSANILLVKINDMTVKGRGMTDSSQWEGRGTLTITLPYNVASVSLFLK